MKIPRGLYCFLVIIVLSCSPEDVVISWENTNSQTSHGECDTFNIQLDPLDCTVDIREELAVNTVYVEVHTAQIRSVTINNIANHSIGEFPNSGNPNAVSPLEETYKMTMIPELADVSTGGRQYTFGIFRSGVTIDPFSDEFFEGPNGENLDWNITPFQNTINLGLDCNNAHVQPNGKYHYHGTPSQMINVLAPEQGSEMIWLGYAADGFPIYYKYAYAEDNTTVVALESAYQLKAGERGGDGVNAPKGCYDGTYVQDYEYVPDASRLDACNGMIGKTPNSEEEYFYLITDNFPSAPLCFSGSPDESFQKK